MRGTRRVCLVAAVASIAFSITLLSCRKLTAELTAGSQTPKRVSAAPGTVVAMIYDGGLKTGWQDWGWGSHDLSRGPARIDMSNFGGWIVRSDQFPSTATGVVFELFAPSSYGSFLRVNLAAGDKDKSFPEVNIVPNHLRALEGNWVEVFVPWSELNPSKAPADRVILSARTKVASIPVQFDKLRLVSGEVRGGTTTAATKPRGARLAIDCRAATQRISPYIYGLSTASNDEVPITAARWGGNPTTRYNWQLGNAWNVGKDWFFLNVEGANYRSFIEDARKKQAIVAVTVPMIGWVAKDTSSYSFSVQKLGAQQEVDPHRPDAGNGVSKSGKLITPEAPTRTSVPASPAFMQKWVEAIREFDQGKRTVRMYFLDNEPSLWNSNHRDVHPEPVSYDELLDRTLRYSAAIRTADPNALIAGPAEWGWTAYFHSAQDVEAGTQLRPDRRKHGDVPLIPWYLQKLREHDKTSPQRALDVLDVHFYPQGDGVYSDRADPATAALRLRSTRALWDPSYKDESWIKDTVRLLPRLKDWIKQNYPGLGLSIGEYSFGGEKHISGGLATAEALGRFAMEGVTYAFYWRDPPKNSPTAWAFRAYRNFDGKGGRFLDNLLATKMAPNVSLFASRDDSGKHIVAVLLNMDPSQVANVDIDLPGCAAVDTRRKFTYTASTPALRDDGSGTGPLTEQLPPYSITVLDIRLK